PKAIKKHTSKTARAAFQLRGKFRVALSGTPVENRLEELWSIMHFANPGLLGGRGDFQERYNRRISLRDPGSRGRARRFPGAIQRTHRRRSARCREAPPREDPSVRAAPHEARGLA